MPPKRKRAPGGGRPRSTGSASTPTVSFRPDAELYARASVSAKSVGLSVGQLGHRALRHFLDTQQEHIEVVASRREELLAAHVKAIEEFRASPHFNVDYTGTMARPKRR